MSRDLSNDFSLPLDPDDAFKYSNGGAGTLILAASCSGGGGFWEQLAAMAGALGDIQGPPDTIKLRRALSAVEEFRHILGVVDEGWRSDAIESELDCDVSLQPLQVEHLIDISACIIRRYLPLNLTGTDECYWPAHWTGDDIAEAQGQDFEGCSGQPPGELVRRLFAEDLQLAVSASTSAACALRLQVPIY